MPLNLVTTTIVAGNANTTDNPRRKRQSKLRLSFSKRGSVVPSPLGSPAFSGFTERSASRVAGRFDAVPEGSAGLGRRERADSYREGLMEEAEFRRRVGVKREGVGSGNGRETPMFRSVT
jgi:hypothetical protein